MQIEGSARARRAHRKRVGRPDAARHAAVGGERRAILAVTTDVRVCEDADDRAPRAAGAVAAAMAGAVQANGQCTVALAGGDTPRALDAALAARFNDGLPWARVQRLLGRRAIRAARRSTAQRGDGEKDPSRSRALPAGTYPPGLHRCRSFRGGGSRLRGDTQTLVSRRMVPVRRRASLLTQPWSCCLIVGRASSRPQGARSYRGRNRKGAW